MLQYPFVSLHVLSFFFSKADGEFWTELTLVEHPYDLSWLWDTLLSSETSVCSSKQRSATTSTNLRSCKLSAGSFASSSMELLKHASKLSEPSLYHVADSYSHPDSTSPKHGKIE